MRVNVSEETPTGRTSRVIRASREAWESWKRWAAHQQNRMDKAGAGYCGADVSGLARTDENSAFAALGFVLACSSTQ